MFFIAIEGVSRFLPVSKIRTTLQFPPLYHFTDEPYIQNQYRLDWQRGFSIASSVMAYSSNYDGVKITTWITTGKSNNIHKRIEISKRKIGIIFGFWWYRDSSETVQVDEELRLRVCFQYQRCKLLSFIT